MTEQKPKILVLMGGPSSEHEVSLMSGQEIVKNLDKNKYEVEEIILAKDFTVFGLDKNITKYDLVFNALHGEFGEDGQLQSILDNLGVKYTGSGVLASAWGMNKHKTDLIAEKSGVQVCQSILVSMDSDLRTIIDNILENIKTPCVIKPNTAGSSVGVEIVREQSDLEQVLQQSLEKAKQVLVQEYIQGRELTCAVLTNHKTEGAKTFPVIEIVPKQKFYDYTAKYQDYATEYICPAKIDGSVSELIQKQSLLVHNLLGCSGLTRSDFILAENGKVYFLEINTSPGMTSHSLCPKAAASVGINYSELLDLIIDYARK